jgi:hypothetical protein
MKLLELIRGSGYFFSLLTGEKEKRACSYLWLERVARAEGPHGLEELIVVLEVLVDTAVKP